MEGKEDDDDDDDDNEEWFACIQAIIIHQSNDNNYNAFLLVEWFDLIGFDSNMISNKYLLQRRNKVWRRIHPISIVSSRQKNHFVHDCNISCIEGKHNVINNRYYFKNDFFFTAV